MKRFTAFIVLAVFLTCGVFAATSVSATSTLSTKTNPDTATLDIDLTVTPELMFYYAFGFSDSNGNNVLATDEYEAVPDAFKGTLSLVYDPKTSTASNTEKPVYMYYKARTLETFDVALKIDSDLTSGSESIGYTVKLYSSGAGDSKEVIFDKTEIHSGADNNIAKGNVAAADDLGMRYGSFGLTFITDTIPLHSTETKYGSSLSLTVTSI